MTPGNFITLNVGAEKEITKKLSTGLSFILPLSTKWNDDGTFFKYDYSDDTQQIARNRFSIGIKVFAIRHF
jgi:hypothetical protein